MNRLFRVALPLVCAFLLLVAQGSPTHAQTGSISCENTDSELICTMTVSTGEKISFVIWVGPWSDNLESSNQLRLTPAQPSDLCGEELHITGGAYRFLGDISLERPYQHIASASTTHTWDCSSSPPRTPTGGNDGGSQNTPTGGSDGGSQNTPTGGNDGGSQNTPTGGNDGGSQNTPTEEDTGDSQATSTEEDTGGSGTIAVETDGAKILLTVEPTEISEEAGTTDVVVTATLDGLDGQVFDDDVVVLLTLDEDINGDGAVNNNDKAARRDVDYVTELRLLAIPPGQESGTTTITVTPINDKKVEGDETIRLKLTRSYPNNQVTVQDAEGADVKLTVIPVDITLQDTGKDGASFFAADAAIDDQTYSVGTAITDLVLPEAADGELTYGTSALPAGLSFDAATRTLAGTPSAATSGAVTIVYTATEEDGPTDTLVFTITIAEAGAVGTEASEEPEASGESEEVESPSLAFAADAAINDQEYTAEWPITDLVLPAASGGTGELTYSISTLPTGLAFDAATRMISGTPSAATDGTVTIVYTVIDEEESTAALTFTITVNEGLDFSNFFDLFGAGK